MSGEKRKVTKRMYLLAGAVQIVYVPYNPYLYNKQAKGSSGYQTDSRTGSIPSGHSGSPSGLYTGPPQYEAYHPSYGPYMPGPSSHYNPYYTSNTYPVSLQLLLLGYFIVSENSKA